MIIRLIALAGKRGSGKSTLALRLERHGLARAAFGDFVRNVAAIRGLDHGVPSLEALGAKLIAELGWENFCKQVLVGTEEADRVVVDGVRHVAARDTLRRVVSPLRAALVFVEVDESERATRLRARARLGDLPEVSEMSNELGALRQEAELVVSGSGDLAAQQVLAWIEASERY